MARDGRRIWLKMAVRALATPWSVFGKLGGGGSIHQYPVKLYSCTRYTGYSIKYKSDRQKRDVKPDGEHDFSRMAWSCASRLQVSGAQHASCRVRR
eukprot:3102177-Prymnesium_polylepis.1